MATSMHDDNIKAAETAIALYMPYNKPAGTNIMKEDKKVARLALWAMALDEIKTKNESIQDDEGFKRWVWTVDKLESIPDVFNEIPSQLNNKQLFEDVRDAVHKILAATKNTYLLRENPDVRQALRRNLLEEIKAGGRVLRGLEKKTATEIKTAEEPMQEIRGKLSNAYKGKMTIQENLDIEKEWSLAAIEHWEKFLKKFDDKDYIARYKECIGELEKQK
jgi:hypothetical protein